MQGYLTYRDRHTSGDCWDTDILNQSLLFRDPTTKTDACSEPEDLPETATPAVTDGTRIF